MNLCVAERCNWRLNWGFPINDPKRYKISILCLICPREPVLVEVDGKIYFFQSVTWPLFSILAQNKYNNGQNWSNKSKILRGVMLWACMHVEKNLSHLDTDIMYMFKKWVCHYEESWLQLLGIYMTRAFRCCMRLKLFLKLVRATGRENTKF